jgi:hypothetical protein
MSESSSGLNSFPEAAQYIANDHESLKVHRLC